MQRMRTASEAFATIQAADPATNLTLHAVKMLVKSGAVPSVKIGRKQLVNMAVLSQYLEGDSPSPQAKIVPFGTIRKVSEV